MSVVMVTSSPEQTSVSVAEIETSHCASDEKMANVAKMKVAILL